MKALDTYLQKWKPKKWVVVECRFTEEGCQYHWKRFRLKKKELVALEEKSETSLQEMSTDLKSTPIILWFTGKGILHQPHQKNWKDRSDIWSAQDQSESYMALTKRENLQKQIDLFKTNNLHLIEVQLGASGFFAYRDEQAIIGLYNFQGSSPLWQPEGQESILWLGQEIPRQWSGHYLSSLKWLKKQSTFGLDWLENFNYLRIQQKIIKGGLPIILGLLLVNFLVYDPLYKNHQKLKAISKLTTFENWENQRIAWEEQQKFLELNAGVVPGKQSWYTDQILLSRPKALELTAIHVFYPGKNLKPGKELKWQDYIQLSGEAKSNDILEDWMSMLEKLEWVDKTELIRLKQTGKKQQFIFKLFPFDE